MRIGLSCIAAMELLQRTGVPYIYCDGEVFPKG